MTAALLAAGCGGSDSQKAGPATTATAPAKLTRGDFIAKADNACRRSQKKQNALRKEAEGKQTSELPPTLLKQARIANGLADEVTGFGTPPGDATRIASFIDSIRQIGVYSKALSESINAGHTTSARKLAGRLARWREAEHTLGQSYGLKVCARGTSY